jgi:hypothetical protein
MSSAVSEDPRSKDCNKLRQYDGVQPEDNLSAWDDRLQGLYLVMKGSLEDYIF